MLIWWMLVSTVICSPLHESADDNASELDGKLRRQQFSQGHRRDLPPFHLSRSSIPHQVDLDKPGSDVPTSQNVANVGDDEGVGLYVAEDASLSTRNAASGFTRVSPADSEEGNFNINNNFENSNNYYPKRENSEGNYRSARDSPMRPPLVLAQQPSDLILEPTDIEAPDTTPTTVAMMSEVHSPAPEVSQKAKDAGNTSLPSRDKAVDQSYFSNSNLGDFDVKFKKINARSFDTVLRDQLIDQPIGELSTKENIALLSDLLLSDEPARPLRHKPFNNSQNREFQIKSINKTHKLAQPKPYQSLYPSSLKQSNENKQSDHDKHNFDKASVQADQPYTIDADTSSQLSKEVNNKSSYTTRRRESKRIADHQIFKHSSTKDDSTKFSSPKSYGTENPDRNKNKITYIPKNGKVTLVIERKPTENTKALPISRSTTHDLKANTTTKDFESNSENKFNKEINPESVIGLSGPLPNNRKVKKDIFVNKNSSGDTNQEEKTFLITSSSEVSYKQFDPIDTKNSSTSKSAIIHNVLASDANLSDMIQKDTSKNLLMEKSHKELNFTSIKSRNSNESLKSSLDENKNNKEKPDELNITPLPNQTSAVEPSRVNLSSVTEVILPSSPPSIHPSSNLPTNPISPDDILPPVSLGVHPKAPVERGVSGTPPPLQQEQVSEPVSEQVERPIGVGGVVAIVVGVLLAMGLVGGVTAFIVYRRLEGFRPKILSPDRSCANSDSGGYLDDQCRVAYVNSQIDLPKSTPEDLVSLDNDSFLNSLESMTIQNLWTDNIRHTKL